MYFYTQKKINKNQLFTYRVYFQKFVSQINTLRSERMANILQTTFLNDWKFFIFIQITLEFVPKGPIDSNFYILIQITLEFVPKGLIDTESALVLTKSSGTTWYHWASMS